MENKKSSKFLLGAIVGAGVALLLAPKSGKELRKDIKVKFDQILEDIKELDMEDVKENISNKIKEIEEDIKNFDKEKALKSAKAKAKEIEKKAESLIVEAKKTAKPELVKLVDETKKKTVKVLKLAVDKLEKENN